MKTVLIAAIAIMGISGSAHAITWGKTSVDDPFAPGKKCKVAEPMSYGSYIYEYPEKWDGVYWPHTDPNWIWRCKASGYVAFGSEFEVESETKAAIGEWLKQNGKPGKSVEDGLKRIEELDRFRIRSPADAAWFKRLMAYWRDEADPVRADQYRRESIPLMIAALPKAKPDDQIQLYFLLGVYAEKFEGPAAADSWFSKAREVKWTDEDGKEQVGAPYFNELIGEVLAQRPGR